MKKTLFVAVIVMLLGILVWGFITPSGIRGAWANNLWSTRFVKAYYEEPGSLSQLPPPPSTHVHGNLFLIQRAIQNQDYDLAMEYINPLVEASDPLALDAYVTILYFQEDYTKALELWEKIGNIRIIERAALDLVGKGRQDLALLGYRTLYQVNPEKYAISLAVPLKNQGEFEEALRIFQDSINNFPNSEFKYHWLRYSADIYQRQQKYEQAEATYMETLKVNPEDSRTWRNLGVLYSANFKDYNQAISCFEKMIEIDPQDSFGYFLLGQTYESAGLIEKAIEAYQTTLEKDPGYEAAQQAVERLTSANKTNE